MAEEKWCEIFRTGTHTSSNGTTHTWTEGDLDTMVQKFNEKQPTVPIVIGHPKSDNPAYGWVDKVKRVGDTLVAQFKQVNQEFTEWVKKGLYKNRSISLYPDMTLRHIGFLGAVPPAVKGLAEFQFSDDDEFQEYVLSAPQLRSGCNGGSSCTVRKSPIAKGNHISVDSAAAGVNAEKQLTQSAGDGGLSFKEQEEERIQRMKEENQKQELEKQELESQKQELEKQNKEFSEQISSKDEEIKNLKAQIEAQEKAKRQAENAQFAEELIKSGSITPAQKSVVVDFMEIAANQGQYDFAEGDEKDVSKAFKTFLQGIKQIDFSEVATKDKAKEKQDTIDFSDGQSIAIAINKKKQEYAKEGRVVSEGEILKELKGANNDD